MLQTFSWRSPSQPLPELNLQLLQVREQALVNLQLGMLLEIRCGGRSFRLGHYLAARSLWSLARRYSQIFAEVEIVQSLDVLI